MSYRLHFFFAAVVLVVSIKLLVVSMLMGGPRLEIFFSLLAAAGIYLSFCLVMERAP